MLTREELLASMRASVGAELATLGNVRRAMYRRWGLLRSRLCWPHTTPASECLGLH
uniref:Uncharacterized protein n=1 Tax=Ulva partita TaxID=1605170 RepID=A0A1C9ZPX8_9CHLO|nr:hypothetical protein [Ulva partita]